VHRLRAIGSFATDFKAWLRFEHGPQPPAYDGMIVRDQNTVGPIRHSTSLRAGVYPQVLYSQSVVLLNQEPVVFQSGYQCHSGTDGEGLLNRDLSNSRKPRKLLSNAVLEKVKYRQYDRLKEGTVRSVVVPSGYVAVELDCSLGIIQRCVRSLGAED
jgi:hypothetical protein